MDWAIWPLIRTGAHFNAAGWGTLLQWWMYATRYSLLVTALVALLASLAGAVGGWLAAGGPRFFDFSLRKVVEISGALPGLILVAALRVSGLVPPGLDVMLVLFVLRSIEIAHLVRSLMLSLGDRDFLIAARSIGGSPLHILRWHLLPHLARPLGALVVTTLASVVSLEAALSVIGLGTPKLASWGVMLITQSSAALPVAPLCALLSAIATTLALSILARQLQQDRWVLRHHV
jgi:ABC-type dipeptide/oligopeptide/nickel transport system permease subunit